VTDNEREEQRQASDQFMLQDMNTGIRLQRFLELDGRTCTHGADYTVVR
jgi:hypothetical protein